jgi:hypothetical protein
MIRDLLTRMKRLSEPNAEDETTRTLDDTDELVAIIGLDDVAQRHVEQEKGNTADLEGAVSESRCPELLRSSLR